MNDGIIGMEDERARRDNDSEPWYVWWRRAVTEMTAAVDAYQSRAEATDG